MNSLKTLFIVAVLGAVAYGVYVSINHSPETPPDLEDAPAWPQAPQVQLPGPGAATPQFPPARSGAEMAPAFSPGATAAPAGPSAPDPLAPAARSEVGGPHVSLGTPASPAGAPGVAGPSAYSLGAGAPTSAGSASGSPDAAAGDGRLPPARTDRSPGLAGSPLRGPGVSTSDLPVGRAPPAESAGKFDALMQAVQAKLEQGHLAEALLALTALHDSPIVPPEQVQKVTRLLDQLAGTVVYSRQHLLEPPYRVRPHETLEQIAETYQVPWQLLAKINGVRDPRDLQPGQELKVLRGPFNALVNLDKFELTLMVGGRYAGRFPIGVGRDYSHADGSYVVRDKVLNPTGFDSRSAPGAGDPGSQLPGTYWIDLGGRLGIHGTSNPQDLHRSGGQGSICLGQRDIEDVYGILSVGSRVIIRR